jgi:diguanylate cyclase (GGDEF)-like protein
MLFSQLRLADRLSRSRIRSWMRGKRLAASAAELVNTRKRLGLTLDYISQGLAMYDANRKLVFANRCYAELYGLNAEQLRPGMDIGEVFALRAANGAYGGAAGEGDPKIPYEPTGADRLDHLQSGRTMLVREKAIEDGGWVTVEEDVTERARAAQDLAHSALHDSLTQLPNRQAFKNHLAGCLAAARGRRFAILMADIDGFKEVNDTYGHEIGDEALVEVAARLSREAKGHYVARLGGDEFVVVVAGEWLDAAAATRIAERLIAAIEQPVEVGGRVIALGLCIGVNLIDADEREFSCIMRRADLALYAAKNGGRNCVRRFDEEMERQYSDRVRLAQDLREAIAQDQLAVHYQPIVDAAGRRIVCMEALARWRHPSRGPISPATFVPIAEETGLIVTLGAWVLNRACADAATWRKDVVLAVNVSSLQIERPEFVETVMGILERTQLAPHRLQIEITESILLRNDDETNRALDRLRALGVTFALDDFGTGFASLAYLKAFPLGKVKIDKSFVDDICLNRQSIAIVAAIVALARGLDIETTAEGVETQDQYDALRAIGVATMQGYFFGRPQAIGDFDPSAVSDARAA